MKKRMISLALAVMMLLVPSVVIEASAVSLPAQNNAPNLAAASTLTLTHSHVSTYPDKVATYNAETDAITMTGHNVGSSLAYTTAPAVLDGKNYVLTFHTATKGWSNTWKLTVKFADEGGLSQILTICDKYVAYTDAAGTVHQLENSLTNGTRSKFSVFVRQEANNTCGIYIYINNVLKGEFHKQQVLTPTLRFTGPNANTSWMPVITNLAMYATAEMYGDVDGNGTVNQADATALEAYLADTSLTINLSNADVDQDGTITAEDHTALIRYLEGRLGYELPYIPTIVVTEHGVDNTGTTDMTDLLTELHATGKRIYYPNGTYLFNGETLDFSGGVVFQSQDGVLIRNDISNVNIINFDDNGNLIGLMQNHLEYTCAAKNDPLFVKTGSLVSPPISMANYNTAVDFLPLWYNDFGLHTRYATANGNVKWYDWKWNHHTVPDTPQVKFAHGTYSANATSTWNISNVSVYKPTGSDPMTVPDNATEYANPDYLTTGAGKENATTVDGATIQIPRADAYATYKLRGLKKTDDYVVRFTTASLAWWDANLTITVDGQVFTLKRAGLYYNGEQLTYPDSSLTGKSTVTYSLYVQVNADGTHTISVYANGVLMTKSDATTPANFTYTPDLSAETYDPTRHPLLGWYFGDDATVLDWQCYWLQEYGMNQAALYTASELTDAWSDPANPNYWIYQVFNNTPNAKYMNFSMYVKSPASYNNDTTTYMTEESYRAAWWSTFEQVYFQYDNIYCYEVNGKEYPVVCIWDEKAVAYNLGGRTDNSTGVANLTALYKDVAEAFKDQGYDGVCILARTPKFTGTSYAATVSDLRNNDVYWVGATYSYNGIAAAESGVTRNYTELVDAFDASLVNTDTVFGVATSLHSSAAHSSTWVCPGSNALDFGRWIQKAVAATTADSNRTKIITCYNIAEWGEGGQSLQPSVANRFEYLEAVRDNIVIQ